MASKNFFWVGTILAVLLVSVGILAFQFRPGIRVTLHNAGSSTIRSVALHVTGSSTSLGDIHSGAEAITRVRPTGESSLEIEFVDQDGKSVRLDANCYFESGYRGTIQVLVKDRKIIKKQQDINLW